ncbi:MAG: hypothetical protein ACKOHG_05055, partial [Planctomycetia bacterium]
MLSLGQAALDSGISDSAGGRRVPAASARFQLQQFLELDRVAKPHRDPVFAGIASVMASRNT